MPAAIFFPLSNAICKLAKRLYFCTNHFNCHIYLSFCLCLNLVLTKHHTRSLKSSIIMGYGRKQSPPCAHGERARGTDVQYGVTLGYTVDAHAQPFCACADGWDYFLPLFENITCFLMILLNLVVSFNLIKFVYSFI